MAFCMQSKSALATRSARSVRVEAVHGVERAQIATATFAAAALLVSPAFAGVVMSQPTLKKAFIDDTPEKVREAPKPREASSGPSFSFPSFGSSPAPKAEVKKVVEEKKKDEAPPADGLDPRVVALPASVVFVGGLAFAASKVDSEFDDFIKGTIIKDSNLGQAGLGYEEVVKSTYGGIYGTPTAAGTRKVKASKKK